MDQGSVGLLLAAQVVVVPAAGVHFVAVIHDDCWEFVLGDRLPTVDANPLLLSLFPHGSAPFALFLVDTLQPDGVLRPVQAGDELDGWGWAGTLGADVLRVGFLPQLARETSCDFTHTHESLDGNTALPGGEEDARYYPELGSHDIP